MTFFYHLHIIITHYIMYITLMSDHIHYEKIKHFEQIKKRQVICVFLRQEKQINKSVVIRRGEGNIDWKTGRAFSS